MSHKTKKPLDTDSLAADVSKGFDKTDKLNTRLERYSNAKHRALENLNYLCTASPITPAMTMRYQKAAALLATCGNYLLFRDYYTVGMVRLYSASFCKQHLICPLCAIRRGAKSLKAYSDRFKLLNTQNPTWRLSMITLTVKNGADLQERFTHLQKAVKRVFERRRDWLKKGWGLTEWSKVHGYVGTYEFTNKGNGWHPHAHIMCLHSETFDYKALKAEWKEITGDSHVLNVTAAKHPKEPELDFLEVFKYAVKFSDLSPQNNIHAWEILQGRRLLFSGGAFRGVVIPENLADEELDSLPYVELLYSYMLGGYKLKSTSYHLPERDSL